METTKRKRRRKLSLNQRIDAPTPKLYKWLRHLGALILGSGIVVASGTVPFLQPLAPLGWQIAAGGAMAAFGAQAQVDYKKLDEKDNAEQSGNQ